MSTRATYEFRDDLDKFTIYKHDGGWPKAALEAIKNSLKYAWSLPRYEASEFAAAFVAANKNSAGGVYLTTDCLRHGDTEFHYVIEQLGEILYVVCYKRDDTNKFTFVTQGPIEDVLSYYNAVKGE